MSLYILDSKFRRETLIDQYSSLIWTERYNAFGDFQLDIPATAETRKLFRVDKWLGRDGSKRIMRIETVESSSDEEGTATLSISGTSMERVLDRRPAVYPVTTYLEIPAWTFAGTPAAIVQDMFDGVCGKTAKNGFNKIPFLKDGNPFPADTLPLPEDTIIVEVKAGASLYTNIKEICDAYDLGFRIVKGDDNQELYFNIYSGRDRTSSQKNDPAVVFSQSLDNLSNVTELTSVAQYFNAVEIFAPEFYTVEYATDTPLTAGGFDLHSTVEIIESWPEEYEGSEEEIWSQKQAYLHQRGKEILAQSKKVNAFDGEATPNSVYKYGLHYQLGDVAEIRGAEDVTKTVRVSEQIYIHDKEGIREYPTFTDILFITPGSWLSWDYNQVWPDVTKHWNEA